MKLRNKKTKEVGVLRNITFSLLGDVATIQLIIEDGYNITHYYHTLSEIYAEWEDYAPAEPLIKDEKIRKAVRAWAEMNDIRFIHMCSRTRKENARIVGQNAVGRTFTMEIANEYEVRVCFKDYKECYTIAELCGEEEECES